MKKSRTYYTLMNSSISMIIQIITMVLKFVIQTMLIHKLGVQYVGVNGLFSNVLSVLSFAELGLGSAITFSLYGQLAKNNQKKISAFLNFYRNAYHIIGVSIGLIGVLAVPFLHFFIKGNTVPDIYILYLLFLSNSVVSYFFAYKRSLLTADQKDYISSLNQFMFYLLQFAIQMIILIVFQNYIFFLIVQVLCTILSNLRISIQVDKLYPYLNSFKHERLDKTDIKILIKNSVELFGSKIGGIVLNSTDNILISSFIGLTSVGIYSNYSLITTSVTTIVNKITSATTPSIGNLAIDHDTDKSLRIFNLHLFINFVLTVLCGSFLLNLLNPFITLWIGKKYLLSFVTVLIIAVNFSLTQLRQTAISFMNAYGTFRFQGIKSILEAVINLGISIVLIRFTDLGIGAVILGTTITTLLLSSWWENYQVFTRGFHLSVKNTLLRQYGYLVILLLIIIGNYYLTLPLIATVNVLHFVFLILATFLIDAVVISLFFFRTYEFKYLKAMFIRVFKRGISIIKR